MKLTELQLIIAEAIEKNGDDNIRALKLGTYDAPAFIFETASVNMMAGGAGFVLEFYPKQGT